MRIALDAMGGDLAPKATVEGAVLAARDFGIEIVLVGDRELLTRELAEHRIGGLKITVEHAPESVAMDASPLESVLEQAAVLDSRWPRDGQARRRRALSSAPVTRAP